eukprot:11221430-Prorocentrum_lima.AAC.1
MAPPCPSGGVCLKGHRANSKALSRQSAHACPTEAEGAVDLVYGLRVPGPVGPEHASFAAGAPAVAGPGGAAAEGV